MPATLVCVAMIISGVPFGMQTAWLSISKTGIPSDNMRVAAVTHCAEVHGLGTPATLNGQPAITQGIGCITIG